MLQIAGGVYRSNVDTNAFEPDEESGGGILQHFLREDDEMQAGLRAMRVA